MMRDKKDSINIQEQKVIRAGSLKISVNNNCILMVKSIPLYTIAIYILMILYLFYEKFITLDMACALGVFFVGDLSIQNRYYYR